MCRGNMQVVECPHEAKVDPRVKRTRKLIIDAFRALMNERPFAEISVADITDRATVNRATFYAHFEDKDHLASSMIKGELEVALLEKLKDCRAVTPENLQMIGVAVFDFIAGAHLSCPKTGCDLEKTIGGTLREAIYAFVSKWIEMDPAGLKYFGGSGPDTVATVVAWSFYGGSMNWTKYTKRPTSEAAVREITKMLVKLERPLTTGTVI